jgi:excisionase family DNA binding protein
MPVCGQLLNVIQTAAMLGMKESTIRSWILDRRIPFVRMGRRVFVRRIDVEQLIEANVVYPGSKPVVRVRGPIKCKSMVE